MTRISFEANLLEINTWIVIKLNEEASSMLPSRGMGMIEGTINSIPFQSAVEPDGRKGHWFEVDQKLFDKIGLPIGSSVSLEVEPLSDWLEPQVPKDLMSTLITEELTQTWEDLTTKAKWEWIRWIRSTQNSKTREKRIETATSKLQSGKKRPCCYDSSRCSIPNISKTGILLDITSSS